MKKRNLDKAVYNKFSVAKIEQYKSTLNYFKATHLTFSSRISSFTFSKFFHWINLLSFLSHNHTTFGCFCIQMIDIEFHVLSLTHYQYFRDDICDFYIFCFAQCQLTCHFLFIRICLTEYHTRRRLLNALWYKLRFRSKTLIIILNDKCIESMS